MVYAHKLVTSKQSEEAEKSTSPVDTVAKKLSVSTMRIEENGDIEDGNNMINNENGRLRLRLNVSERPIYKEESSDDDYKRKKAKPKKRRKLIHRKPKNNTNENEQMTNSNEVVSNVSEIIGRKRKTEACKENLKKQKKKPGRIRKEDGTPPASRRRAIRHLLKTNELNKETKDAEKQEEERQKRLENLKEDKIVEIDVDKSDDNGIPVPITKRLVLQKKPLVEVHPHITVYLKPHQVEGIKFIWDNLIESTKQAEKKSGSGCILAHCMGLGKTLQTIAVVHTILNSKHLNLKTVLVVAPLNTVLNWMDELTKWIPEEQPLTLYNLDECPTTRSRLDILKEWTDTGGVMVMGYDMFRLLASTCRIRYHQWKLAFAQLLLNPGPDLIVCDEGHKLKNSSSNISLIMNKIKTARRLVLTGTPLQNNLMEYQCMVNFVKPNLLGSMKEFRNRFVNPILNGQHSNSTNEDVRLMKKRCHILHDMLRGFVQRKDYTALAKYLCEKLEYVVKVRLTPLQTRLYRRYLDTKTNRGANQHAILQGAEDTGLFADYQHLMRVWTHPRLLQLHSKRQECFTRLVYADDSTDEMSFDSGEEERELNSEDEAKKNEDSKRQFSYQSQRTSGDLTLRLWESDASGCSSNLANGNPTISSFQEDESDEDSCDSFSSLEEVRPWHRRQCKRRGGYILRGENSDSDDETRRLDAEAEAQREANKLENNSWYSSLLKECASEINSPTAGGKIAVLFEILRLAQECDDKVLVFSQSILSLDLIEEMLALSTMKAVSLEEESASKTSQDTSNTSSEPSTRLPESSKDLMYQKWYKNIDYFRIDGCSLGRLRQKRINEFNDESDRRARLFLISTKAGSLGVNLVAANRVVIFDASWNPTHDLQSIFRIYRFGQSKCCYIYRLIAQGTMEDKIYDRQVTKQSLAFRVIDEQQINRYFTAHDLQELYTFSPPADQSEAKMPALPKDKLLAELLMSPSTKGLISSYHTHDSLLDHQEKEELTEEERAAAWKEYENEKQRNRPVPRPGADNPGANSSKVMKRQLTMRQQTMLLHQLQRVKEKEKLKKIATQLQIKGYKPPTTSRYQIQSLTFLLLKASEHMQKLAKKVEELKPLDLLEAVNNLKKLPMYDAMKEDSVRELAVELKVRRQTLRLTAEKELRQAKSQMEWLSKRQSQLLQSASKNKAKASESTTSSAPTKSLPFSSIPPSAPTKSLPFSSIPPSAPTKSLPFSSIPPASFSCLSNLLQQMSASISSSATYARIPSVNKMETQVAADAQASNGKKDAMRSKVIPMKIDSDAENLPFKIAKTDPWRTNPIYVVGLEDKSVKATAHVDKPSTSNAIPTASMPVIHNASFRTIRPKPSDQTFPVLNGNQKFSILFQNSFPQFLNGDAASRSKLFPQLIEQNQKEDKVSSSNDVNQNVAS